MKKTEPELRIEADRNGIRVYCDGSIVEILALYMTAGANLIPPQLHSNDNVLRTTLDILGNRTLWEFVFSARGNVDAVSVDLSAIHQVLKKTREENQDDKK